jgi:hypothetical protein
MGGPAVGRKDVREMNIREADIGGASGRALTWTYRVAQNPQVFLPLSASVLMTVAWFSLDSYLEDPEDYARLLVAVAFLGLIPPGLIVGGYGHLRLGPRLDDEIKRVPPRSQWIFNIPLWSGLAALGASVVLDFKYPRRGDFSEVWAEWVMLGFGWVILLLVLAGVVLRVHRCGLVFTPDALEYTGPRFHASIPWDAVTALKPVGDAFHFAGGLGEVDKPSRHNLRPGVQLTVRDGVDIVGRSRLLRIKGQDVICVDCSCYKIDPNTLINAIFLLVENPELRPLAGRPEGEDLFVGPTWNTRRKMRVGDRWNRTTGQILRPPITAAS